MSNKKTSLTLLTLALSGLASAQFLIRNEARASMYDPLNDIQYQEFNNPAAWDTASHSTSMTATSRHHPFDPPYNVARATSRFEQPGYADATIRASSFVLSDYSGVGLTTPYKASSSFDLSQTLTVDVGGLPGASIHIKLFVPMHGMLAARGNGSSGALGKASAGMSAGVYNATGILLDEYSGDVKLTSTDFDVFTYVASPNWANGVTNKVVTLPSDDHRQSNGIEISSFDILDLGLVPTATLSTFRVEYDMYTEVSTTSTSGVHALADFSGTGSVKFLAFDDQGNAFNDFTVGAAVPEPASFAALGLGLLALLGRRKGKQRSS